MTDFCVLSLREFVFIKILEVARYLLCFSFLSCDLYFILVISKRYSSGKV